MNCPKCNQDVQMLKFTTTGVMCRDCHNAEQAEARIGLRLKGKRTQYVCALSDVYRMAALWHGQKEAAAKRAARKAGVPWKSAKQQFIAANSI